jgi:SAM-dependent methyltransferase
VGIDEDWSPEHASEVYRHKLVDVPQILADWFEPFGGIAGREVLEFGCGEGTMALGVALQHSPSRVVGVEILDVYKNCLPFAKKHLGLNLLPSNLHLEGIGPGQGLRHLGLFDFAYSWSVFEHVSQNLLEAALRSIQSVLKPNGIFMLQISPLYHSAFGSHLGPWIPEPWAHLSMPDDAYRRRFFDSPAATPEIMESWSVYLPEGAGCRESRQLIWDTYHTLNKVTAPQLARVVKTAGFEIVRDYRTTCDHPIPDHLADIFDQRALSTEQVVWLLRPQFHVS